MKADKDQILIDKTIEMIEKISSHKNDKVVLEDGQEFYSLESHTLLSIVKNPGIHNSRIASEFSVTRAVTNKVVGKLMDRGLVSRTQDEEDRKRYKLYPTEKGKKYALQLIEERRITMQPFFKYVSQMNDDEKRIVCDFIEACCKVL